MPFFEKHRNIAVNTNIWVVGRGQVSESSATPNNTFRVVVFRRTGYQKCAKSLGTRFLLAFFARTVGPCWLADGFPAFATRSSGPRRLGSAMSMHLLLGRPSGVLALAQLGGSPSFAARSVGSENHPKPHNHQTHRPKHSHPKPQTAPTSKITQTTKRPATPKGQPI